MLACNVSMFLKTADTYKIFRTQVCFKNQEKNLKMHSCETRNDPDIESHNSADLSKLFIIVCMCTWFYHSIWTQLQWFPPPPSLWIKLFSNQVASMIKLPKITWLILRMDPVTCYWRWRWKIERVLAKKWIFKNM